MIQIPLVFDVNGAEFDGAILAASWSRPVVAEFWSPGCGACRMLGPVLDGVVTALGGRVLLGKVNIDTNRELASRYAIRATPTLKIFRNGQIVGELVGAVSEVELRRRLTPFLPSEAEFLLTAGDELWEQGKRVLAEGKYRRVLELDPRRAHALQRLAEAALARGEISEAKALASHVAPDGLSTADFRALQCRIWFAEQCRDSGLLSACEQRLAVDPHDLAARFYLGACLAKEGRYESALEALLAVVESDRSYGNGAAREGISHLLAIMSGKGQLARRFGPRLAQAGLLNLTRDES